jgi:hypothetical protein
LEHPCADQKWFGAREMSGWKKLEEMIEGDAISLINEPTQPERREEAKSAREIARKRWLVRSKLGERELREKQ